MKRALRNFLWPRFVSSAPNFLQRLGRVAHWSFVAVAPFMLFALWSTSSAPPDVAIAVFAGLLLAGRAIRYILSAE